MNIFTILLSLIMLAVLFVAGVAVLIACFKRRWKMAGVIAAIPAAGFAFISLCREMNDPYVRRPVTEEEVVGTYHLSDEAGLGLEGYKRLQRMGYTDFTGEITFTADGLFRASRIPACCVHGFDETTYPFTGGYFDLDGRWKIQQDGSSWKVWLEHAGHQLRDVPTSSDPAIVRERNCPEGAVNLVKGKPLSIAFEVFNGDFDDIVFSRTSLKIP